MCYGQVLSDKLVVGRKQHYCDLCSEPIRKGERSYVQKGKDGGDFTEFRSHERCVVLSWTLREDVCDIGEKDYQREMAAERGWKSTLREARAKLRNLRARLLPPGGAS
jgi:hypothetical protein